MNNNEDVILLSRKAKDETEDFINQHFENQTKGWPKVCLYNVSYSDKYKRLKSEKENILIPLSRTNPCKI